MKNRNKKKNIKYIKIKNNRRVKENREKEMTVPKRRARNFIEYDEGC